MDGEERLGRAREFIWRNGRLLDRHLFACLFDGGQREPVLAALRAYQNADGGFGNALEPDKRYAAVPWLHARGHSVGARHGSPPRPAVDLRPVPIRRHRVGVLQLHPGKPEQRHDR